jgi:chemotaxis protein MotB
VSRFVHRAALMNRWNFMVLGAVIGSTGCVGKGTYDEAVASADVAQADARQCHADQAALRAQLADFDGHLKAAEVLAKERDTILAAAQGSSHDLQSKLDDATAQNAQLRKELERLGKDADKLLTEKGTLSGALDQARSRLEELRRAQAAADARAALYRDLAFKLHKMIDSGELSIGLRNGRMVILLPNDVLFASGQTDIKPAGRKALEQVASVLKTVGRRQFQVAGHTDTVPINTPRFASNWELSTGRAVEVVHFLVGQGLAPGVLSAAGYGEFDPVASNAADGGRTRNRRIEITLQPSIDELVYVPDAK